MPSIMEIEDIIVLSWFWLGFSVLVFIYDRTFIERVGAIQINHKITV
jgi:hypothetical protein